MGRWLGGRGREHVRRPSRGPRPVRGVRVRARGPGRGLRPLGPEPGPAQEPGSDPGTGPAGCSDPGGRVRAHPEEAARGRGGLVSRASCPGARGRPAARERWRSQEANCRGCEAESVGTPSFSPQLPPTRRSPTPREPTRIALGREPRGSRQAAGSSATPEPASGSGRWLGRRERWELWKPVLHITEPSFGQLQLLQT